MCTKWRAYLAVAFFVPVRISAVVVVSLPWTLPSRQVFFCKYNDPIYVKMEKLETIIRLVNDRNVDQVRFWTTCV